MGVPAVGDEKPYLDHCEEDADRAENSLGWCDTGDLLGKIHGFDGDIQRRYGPISPLRSLRFGFHRRDPTWRREQGWPAGCEGGAVP